MHNTNDLNLEVRSDEHRVVINGAGGIVRGFIQLEKGNTVEDLRNHRNGLSLSTIRLRLVGSSSYEEISTEAAKAVFFVSSFEGERDRKDLRFHQDSPVPEGVWVQVEFADGEIMEGILRNSIDYLLEPALLLLPTDPGGNNQLVYVPKTSMKDFRVLGVRPI